MGDPFVQVAGLGKRYERQWAVRNLSFDVGRGEIFGIIGPNGAGKTTTLKVLAGLLTPTEGRASVGGIGTEDPRHKHRIGYLPEDSALYEDMTAVGYLRFFARLYEVPRRTADERIEDVLTRLSLDAWDDKKIGDMSKGMKRKVAIARTLIHDPEMVIYDEPASGLDPVVSAYVLDLVRDLRRRGKTVIFSAHNLYHVERICDRVLILRRGQVVASGDMKDIRQATRGTQYVVTVSVPIEGAAPGEQGFETTVHDVAEVKGIEERALAAGGRLVDVRTKELSLEEIFLRTTGPDAPAPGA
ncbi:MAG TPA: ABC transporter ATP-binding protein [Candidatus Thermoplasmatota archaeon]|nr:ABC transporter ATP-binding protein [Candidatus Thermoplasmatota archaeon]